MRFQLRLLDLRTVPDALDVMGRYFDPARVPIETRLALQQLLGGQDGMEVR